MKQLKKNDFIGVVTEEPMTKAQLVDALHEYEYVSTYLDYLIDHFEQRGMVIKNPDGTFNRKIGKNKSASKYVYRVQFGREISEAHLQVALHTGVLSDALKKQGWSITINAAIKKACSKVFQNYKDLTNKVRSFTEENSVNVILDEGPADQLDMFSDEKTAA